MKHQNKNFLFVILLFLAQINQPMSFDETKEPRFAIIIPSHNNKDWYEKNLNSVLSQWYQRYRIIYIDDCSSDGTGELVQQYIDKHHVSNKVKLIRNKKRKGALANLYCGIHSCDDDEIVVILDGDDWLAHEKVLTILGRTYRDEKVWLTYGQYIDTWGGLGCCKSIDQHVIKQNLYRKSYNVASHLRTFYAWLFKRVQIEDLLYHGEFFPMTGDWAMMFPLLEMSGGRFKFIQKVLYIYNIENPINDIKVDEKFQTYLGRVIQQRKPYQPLEAPAISEAEQAGLCYLILTADHNNNAIDLEQAIDQLKNKQQSVIASIDVVDKTKQDQSVIKQICLEKSSKAEFAVIVPKNDINCLYETLDNSIDLLRKTGACMCILIKSKKEEGKNSYKQITFNENHCSLLYESIYVSQLGWLSKILSEHYEQGYIFSLHFLKKHAKKIPNLLNDQWELGKGVKTLFSQKAVLLINK